MKDILQSWSILESKFHTNPPDLTPKMFFPNDKLNLSSYIFLLGWARDGDCCKGDT